LARPDELPQAAAALRMLIEKIVLTPGPVRGEIYATLHGELRAILEWTERQAIGNATKRNTPSAFASGVSLSVVAGT
ncbi:DNA resolvase, partial [Haematobacter missouriensis]